MASGSCFLFALNRRSGAIFFQRRASGYGTAATLASCLLYRWRCCFYQRFLVSRRQAWPLMLV